MKKYILICVLIMSLSNAYSQNIIRGEYFIDHDPGFGLATSFQINSPDSDITKNLNVPYSAFPNPGYHYLFSRVLDDNNNWSITGRRLVQVDDNLNDFHVVNVEYFFDTDNGFGNNFSLPLIASTDSTWTFIIPSNQLPLQPWILNDSLFIRVKDDRNVWSLTTIIDSLNFSMVGINELSNLSGVSVFPNPFSDEISVSLSNKEKVKIELFNEKGQLVLVRMINDKERLKTDFLSSGVYFLSVRTTDGKSYTTKLIKK